MSRASRKRARKRRQLLANRDMRRVDLHIHSDLSDGILDPEEVVKKAIAGGLDIIALTDHDMPSSIPPGVAEFDGRSVLVISGVEFTVQYEERELHLLAYFPKDIPVSLREYCRELCEVRARRYDVILRKINMPEISPAPESAYEGKVSLTRLHLAREIVAHGYAKSIAEAFSRWLRHHPEEKSFPHIFSLLERLDSVGAISSWAHPNLDDARKWAGIFSQRGLKAIEAYRPQKGKKYREAIKEIARRSNIYVTGGSDFHGWGEPLGNFSFPATEIENWATQFGFKGFANQL
jgi:predicted metal-dependent phosphoesterase TrpH